jgi:hypothetical protein
VDASKRLTAGEAMQHPWLVGGKASDKGLPGVHHERLVGYQALTQMRNTMAALRLDTAALFKVFSKDGEIDKAQLKQAFRSIGTDLSDEAVNGVMQVLSIILFLQWPRPNRLIIFLQWPRPTLCNQAKHGVVCCGWWRAM